MTYQHPFRTAELHVFKRHDDQPGGCQWIARFEPYSTWPIIVHGKTQAEVVEKAEAFRAQEVERHEAAWIAKRENIEKARRAKAAKSEASA